MSAKTVRRSYTPSPSASSRRRMRWGRAASCLATGSFEPEELRSEYRASLRRLLEAKLEGQELVAPEPVEAEAPTVDLMEALRASVAAAKTGPANPTPAPKKPAASSGRKRAAGRK